MYVSWRCLPRWRTPTTSVPGSAVLARVEINLHAIEPTQLRRQHRVDGVGRPKFDFHTGSREHVFNFRASVRPVAMEAHIQGFTGKHYCPAHGDDEQALLRCFARARFWKTCFNLRGLEEADAADRFGFNSARGAGRRYTQSWVGTDDDLDSIAKTCHDPALRHCLPFGVGVHHGGLNESDRKVVENLFERGAIQVLSVYFHASLGRELSPQDS